jgi:hypothetical protein
MDKNEKTIKQVLEINNIESVIVAWGTNKASLNGKYKETINKVLQIINHFNKPIFAMRFKATANPWHPRNWENSFELDLYEWTISDV